MTGPDMREHTTIYLHQIVAGDEFDTPTMAAQVDDRTVIDEDVFRLDAAKWTGGKVPSFDAPYSVWAGSAAAKGSIRILAEPAAVESGLRKLGESVVEAGGWWVLNPVEAVFSTLLDQALRLRPKWIPTDRPGCYFTEATGQTAGWCRLMATSDRGEGGVPPSVNLDLLDMDTSDAGGLQVAYRVHPHDVVLWPKVQQLLDMIRNQRVAEDEAKLTRAWEIVDELAVEWAAEPTSSQADPQAIGPSLDGHRPKQAAWERTLKRMGRPFS